MTTLEKAEIKRLPAKYKPLSGWKYMWYGLLFAIPVIGWIFLIVCSVKDTNVNRRSFARGFFCAMLTAIILAVALAGALVGLYFAQIPVHPAIDGIVPSVLGLLGITL